MIVWMLICVLDVVILKTHPRYVFTVDFNLEYRDSTSDVDVDVDVVIECSLNVALLRTTFKNGTNQADCSKEHGR